MSEKEAAVVDVALRRAELEARRRAAAARPSALADCGVEHAESALLLAMNRARDLGATNEELYALPPLKGAQRGPVKLYVKIGTLAAGWFKQIRRSPNGAWYKVTRGAPNVGDVFAVEEDGKIAVLRCTEVKPVLGPLYYAERA